MLITGKVNRNKALLSLILKRAIRELNKATTTTTPPRTTPSKNEFIFYQRNTRMSISAHYANGSKNLLRLITQRRRTFASGNAKNYLSSSTFRRRRRTLSFHPFFCRGRQRFTTHVYSYCFAHKTFCLVTFSLPSSS